MAYATVGDAIEVYGETYITRICDRDDNGVVDTTSFERHLTMASQIMDGYLLGRYPLPHPAPPEIFKQLCVDIAVYRATPNADTRTTEMRTRRDDAIEYMDMIRKNEIKLQYATEDTTTANQSQLAETTPGRTIISTAGARTFTPCNTRRIL